MPQRKKPQLPFNALSPKLPTSKAVSDKLRTRNNGDERHTAVEEQCGEER